MLITFSIPTLARIAPRSLGSLDAVGLLKLSIRAFVMLSLIYMCYRLWYHPKRKQVVGMLLPFGLFIGYSLFSTSWSALKAVTFGQAASLLVLFMLGYCIALMVDCEEDYSRIIKNLLTTILIIHLLTLFIYFVFPERGSLNRAAQGIFHPTNSAAAAGVTLLMLWTCYFIWNWRWTRMYLLPGSLITLAVLYFAANRMAVGIAFVLISIIIATLSRRHFFYMVLISLSLVITTYLVVDPGWNGIQVFTDQIAGYMKRGQTADQIADFSGRAEMWEVMWHSFLDSPIIGHGYFVTSKTGNLLVWYLEGNWTAHNMMMQVLVTTGIVGFLLFIIGLLHPARLTIRDFFFRRSERKLGKFLIVMGAWYIGWSLTNESIAGPLMPESVIFFSIVGLATGVRSQQQLDISATRPNGKAVLA